MLHFVQLVGWATAHLQLLTWSKMSHCVTLSLPFSQPTPPNHHSLQPVSKVSNFISKMLLLATDYHQALTAASNVAMWQWLPCCSFSSLSIMAAISPPTTSSTLKTTIYDIHHDIHPAFSSKWAATLLACKLAPANSLSYYQHEPIKKGSLCYPFSFQGMFVIFHPSEHTYGHLYVYSTDCFLYFRFAWTRNQVANKKGWCKLPFFVF